jgi:hypothetical protein
MVGTGQTKEPTSTSLYVTVSGIKMVLEQCERFVQSSAFFRLKTGIATYEVEGGIAVLSASFECSFKPPHIVIKRAAVVTCEIERLISAAKLFCYDEVGFAFWHYHPFQGYEEERIDLQVPDCVLKWASRLPPSYVSVTLDRVSGEE